MDVILDPSFLALGFDPAPGRPPALVAAAERSDRAARTLTAAAATAARLDAGWTGDAADAFRVRLRELPPDLGRAGAAHAAVGHALTEYAAGLTRRQARAAELERRAEELRRARAAALAEVDRLAARPVPPDSPGRVDQSAATDRVEWCGAALDAVLADARRLRAEHRAAAAAAAARVRTATDPPYREPGVLARVTGSVRRWIAEHADTLASVATVLRGVSAGLAMLALVPGFQPVGLLAMAAAGLALGLDAAVHFGTGRGSWRALALDAALTAFPAGPVARAVRAAPLAGAALRAVNRAIPGSVKGPAFRTLGTLPEGVSRDQLARAAARIRTAAGHLGDDVVVQGSRAGHSARAGSDIDFGIRVAPERYAELVAECFDPVRHREALAHAVERGRIFWRRAGLADLRRGLLDDVGRKVDLAIIERGGLFDGEPWLRVR